LPEVGVFTNLCVYLVGENTDHRQTTTCLIFFFVFYTFILMFEYSL